MQIAKTVEQPVQFNSTKTLEIALALAVTQAVTEMALTLHVLLFREDIHKQDQGT